MKKINDNHSRLRYVSANVPAKLSIKTNPTNAPTPIQYQYEYGKKPRDFKMLTPIVSVPSGVNFGMTRITNVSLLNGGLNKAH